MTSFFYKHARTIKELGFDWQGTHIGKERQSLSPFLSPFLCQTTRGENKANRVLFLVSVLYRISQSQIKNDKTVTWHGGFEKYWLEYR
jgi:hypothetical protein